MKKLSLVFVGFLFWFGVQSQEMLWLDSDLDMETRISALIDAMTLDECGIKRYIFVKIEAF